MPHGMGGGSHGNGMHGGPHGGGHGEMGSAPRNGGRGPILGEGGRRHGMNAPMSRPHHVEPAPAPRRHRPHMPLPSYYRPRPHMEISYLRMVLEALYRFRDGRMHPDDMILMREYFGMDPRQADIAACIYYLEHLI